MGGGVFPWDPATTRPPFPAPSAPLRTLFTSGQAGGTFVWAAAAQTSAAGTWAPAEAVLLQAAEAWLGTDPADWKAGPTPGKAERTRRRVEAAFPSREAQERSRFGPFSSRRESQKPGAIGSQ